MSGAETNQADQTPVDSHAEDAAKPNGTNQNTSPPQPGEVERLRSVLIVAERALNEAYARTRSLEDADTFEHARNQVRAALTPSESGEAVSPTPDQPKQEVKDV